MDKEVLKSITVLTIICIISGLLLSIAYVATEPHIIKQSEIRANQKYSEIFPMATDFHKNSKEDVDVFMNDDKIGIVKVSNTMGYGGNIKLLVGIYKNETIAGVRVLEQSETPGLGAKIVFSEFIDQFKNKGKDVSLDNGIDSITGATISSQAVVDGVVNAFVEDKDIKEEKEDLENIDKKTHEEIYEETNEETGEVIDKISSKEINGTKNETIDNESSYIYKSSSENVVLADSNGNVMIKY